MKTVRCAIYTRKSSEEGLEQGFNSLDAQREACAAYILSQASEGWVLIPDIYDDGGISGGTLERPGLQRMLADIAANKIDIIVVYKVDRLTRSLLDFSSLVEAFDKAGTSFVSITQSFNTTTSMGRLTLNMLLSFAQFEREVTAERIRDKISASKARGMWMGGTPPLGYKPDGRSLAVVHEHADLIRRIYDRYLELGSVRSLAIELDSDRVRTPVRTRTNGGQIGGARFSRGQLYQILKNSIYAGDIPHKDQIYPGLHDAIIDRAVWDKVQAALAANLTGGSRAARIAHPAFLAGKVFDEAGGPLVSTHACKGEVRYRYYVSQDIHQHRDAAGAPGMRIPAREIERLVVDTVARAFDDPLALLAMTGLSLSGTDINRLFETTRSTADKLRKQDRDLLRTLVASVEVQATGIDLRLDVHAIGQVLGVSAPEGASVATISAPVRLTRTGRAMRLVHSDGSTAQLATPDPTLIKLLLKARRWWSMLAEGEVGITQLAATEGVTPSWMTRVVRLAFLAPELVDAILAGRQGAMIDGKALTGTDAIPMDWIQQRALFLTGSQTAG
jgi:DNA invertase Pin-like site-specific DNA recombinase